MLAIVGGMGEGGYCWWKGEREGGGYCRWKGEGGGGYCWWKGEREVVAIVGGRGRKSWISLMQ